MVASGLLEKSYNVHTIYSPIRVTQVSLLFSIEILVALVVFCLNLHM